MPEEITAVIEYLRNGATVAPVSTNPRPTGDAQRGLTLFLRNCNGCHGMNGRVGTAMPAFQRKEAPAFSDQDIADVVTYLRTLQKSSIQKAVAHNMTPSTPTGGRP